MKIKSEKDILITNILNYLGKFMKFITYKNLWNEFLEFEIKKGKNNE